MLGCKHPPGDFIGLSGRQWSWYPLNGCGELRTTVDMRIDLGCRQGLIVGNVYMAMWIGFETFAVFSWLHPSSYSDALGLFISRGEDRSLLWPIHISISFSFARTMVQDL